MLPLRWQVLPDACTVMSDLFAMPIRELR